MDAEVKKEVVEKHVYNHDGCGYGYGYGRGYGHPGYGYDCVDGYVNGRRGSRLATQGEALGVGIPALALGAGTAAAMLFGRGRFGRGNDTPENVNIVTGGGMAGNGYGAPSAFQAYSKGCEEVLALTNEMWGLKVNTLNQMAAARERDTAEKFSLYQSQVNGDFGLFKSMRDLYDVLNERYSAKFNDLDKEVAVLKATAPLREQIMLDRIGCAHTDAINYTDRRTCRMIEGQVVLPSTPTVTGYGSVGRCACPAQAAATPAAA